jgi:hydrogenase-4 component F
MAIAGLPPFGVFMSEFLLVTGTFARTPWLAVILVAGLLVAFAAILMRLQQMLLGDPIGISHPVDASLAPLFAHLALVLLGGLYLPPPLVHWFRQVALLLG